MPQLVESGAVVVVGGDPLDESKSSSSELSESDIETSVGATGAAAATFLTFCGGPGKKKAGIPNLFLI